MSKGFLVEMINYEGVAESFGKDFAPRHYNNILFVAEQLRHSDDQVRHFVFRLTWWCLLVIRCVYSLNKALLFWQMELWRQIFQRVENEGDEDGFEEL